MPSNTPMRIISTLLAALFTASTLPAQTFYAPTTVHKIEIVFAESNWDALLDAQKAGAEDYIMARTVTIDGTTYDSVGVKYKGNSTYDARQTKNPFHIELDTYKDQNHQGYKDIKLSNAAKDPSFLREVLSYQIARKYMVAPQSNYANVYVNGTLIGLYSNSESIGKTFVKTYFGSKSNTFVKCNPPAGAGPQTTDLPNLTYLGRDSVEYYDAYELNSDHGWGELIDLCDTLSNNTTSVEQILDVDRALWMLAFDNVLVNLDSYIGGFAQNYYLYRGDDRRFRTVVWDLNESFGRFAMTGSGNLANTAAAQQMSPLLHLTDAKYPLISKLLADPTYRRMYIAHCKTILTENFSNGTYQTTGKTLQTLIDASVQADPNKFYTYANFLANLSSDVTSGGGPRGETTSGIVNLMGGRATYLLNLADFKAAAPTISDLQNSEAPTLGQSVFLTSQVAGATAVTLAHRTTPYSVFSKVAMLDDGAHGDGAANDGVYGVAFTPTSTATEYYLYAENAAAGQFAPARAAHEFYTLTAASATANNVVINEFMASNTATQADQDGEFDDWIELFNATATAVDLTGFTLTDDVTKLTKWSFPAGTTVAPGGYLIVWADEDDDQTGLHASFKLSANGEAIYLVNAAGAIVDQIAFSTQTTDISYGRFPNGTGAFGAMQPTFGRTNANITSTSEAAFAKTRYTIYPNPATSQAFLRVEGGETPAAIRLTDAYGRNIQLLVNGDGSLLLDAIPAGLYAVRTLENRFVGRLVKL